MTETILFLLQNPYCCSARDTRHPQLLRQRDAQCSHPQVTGHGIQGLQHKLLVLGDEVLGHLDVLRHGSVLGHACSRHASVNGGYRA